MTLLHRLDIDYPVFQAPMAGVQGAALAAAVSQAGGLGALPCAMLSPRSPWRFWTAPAAPPRPTG